MMHESDCEPVTMFQMKFSLSVRESGDADLQAASVCEVPGADAAAPTLLHPLAYSPPLLHPSTTFTSTQTSPSTHPATLTFTAL